LQLKRDLPSRDGRICRPQDCAADAAITGPLLEKGDVWSLCLSGVFALQRSIVKSKYAGDISVDAGVQPQRVEGHYFSAGAPGESALSPYPVA
jgi:hypothetical protein